MPSRPNKSDTYFSRGRRHKDGRLEKLSGNYQTNTCQETECSNNSDKTEKSKQTNTKK